MPEWIKAWWSGLSMAMRWFVMICVVLLIAFILGSFVFLGTDWSGPFGWFGSVVQ
jgi:hypothetical protein